jgi:hypothetical protein
MARTKEEIKAYGAAYYVANREKYATNSAIYIASQIEAGLCRQGCGSPHKERSEYCQQCADKKAAIERRRRAKLKADGFCRYGCGRPHKEGSETCQKCLDKDAARRFADYALRKNPQNGHLFQGAFEHGRYRGKRIKNAPDRAIHPLLTLLPELPPRQPPKKKTLEELFEQADKAPPFAWEIPSTPTDLRRKRDQRVVRAVIAHGDGVCECGCDVTFPYLECHHVWAIKDGGPDTIYNCLALRPDCHARADREPEFNATLYARLQKETAPA